MKTLACVVCAAWLGCTGVSCGPSSQEPSQEGASPSEPSVEGPSSEVFYFNSFESSADTVGWEGISSQMLVNDPAPGGGDRSLHIGGDCIQPTAHIVFPPSGSDGSYRLSFWGKIHDSAQRGRLILRIDGDDEQGVEAGLTVDSDRWAFYKSKRPLYLSAGEALRLEIMVGGIVAASMSVDCIKIEMSRQGYPGGLTEERGGTDPAVKAREES